MRKIILISLTVFLVIAGGAYCAAWLTQASQIRRGVEQAIARLNATQPYLTYASIETSGFPTKVDVSIVKPHFKGRVDTLLKTLLANRPNNPAATMPEWDEDIALDGRITLSVNALSNRYGYRISGNMTDNANLGGAMHAFASQTAGDGTCTLRLEHTGGGFGTLWSYRTIADEAASKTLLQDFRELDCYGPGNSIVDAATHAALASVGPSRIYVTSAPHGAERSVRLYVKDADIQVTPQGDALINAYFHVFSPAQSTPPMLSAYGKQNIEMDFSYNGPADLKAMPQNPKLDIHLSKCAISTQLSNFNMAFDLTNGMNGNKRDSRFNFDMTEDFGEGYDAMAQTGLHNFVQTAYSSTDPKFTPMQAALHKYTADQDYAILYTVLPHFHALGHVVQALDVSYSGAPDMKAGDISLTNIELSATPYGITGKGTAKINQGSPVPAANVTLTCHNCAPLIDDLMAYAGRVKTALSYYEPDEAARINIAPQLAQAIKSFLGALSGQAAAADYAYVLASDGGMGITINGKRMDEVTGLYRDIVVPALRASAAPAPASAAPAAAAAMAPAR